MPSVEAVPKSYAEQIRWERDIAIEQLNEIGCQFGQKMDELKKKLEVLQWIPCSERLPEDETDILVTYIDGEETRIVPVNYDRGTWFDCIFDREIISKIYFLWFFSLCY